MEDFYAFVRSAWVVWMLILFVGIVVWVLRPSNRQRFRDASQIPLSEDDSSRPTTTGNASDRT